MTCAIYQMTGLLSSQTQRKLNVESMPIDLKYSQLGYMCTKCKKKSQVSLPYLTGQSKVKMEKKGFCTNRFCEATHYFNYRVTVEKESGVPQFKFVKFLVNEEDQEVQVM